MNSTPIAVFRSPVLAILNSHSAAPIGAEAVDKAVRSVVVLELHKQCKLSDDQSAIMPELAPGSEIYNLVVKRTLLCFRGTLSKEQIDNLGFEIFEIENGQGCG